MMRLPLRNLWPGRLPRGQAGGAGVYALVALIALAAPVGVGAVVTGGQLARNSQVYARRLTGMYTAGAGIEYVLWKVLNDPGFGAGLTPESPMQEVTVESDGQVVTVQVTKVFSVIDLQGQAVVVTKEVSPDTAPPHTEITYTYTLTLSNEGTGPVPIKQVYDYLPPRLTYVSGSTSGLTTQDPTTNNSTPVACGSKPYQLYWNVEPEDILIPTGEQRTLTFQAQGRLPDGTFYNQARVRYVPWWNETGTWVDVYTPYMAEVVVGPGTPYCGFDLNVIVTKEVEPSIGEPGIEQEFTYTVRLENLSSGDRYVCKVEDRLPPTFTYVAGSAAEYPINIRTTEPVLTWDGVATRWSLTWRDGIGSHLMPLATLACGEIRTQVFRTRTTPQPGVNYFNEVSGVWSKALVGDHCKTGSGDGGASSWGGVIEGGAAEEAEVSGLIIYDIVAITADGRIQSRVLFYQVDGRVEILSWQEY